MQVTIKQVEAKKITITPQGQVLTLRFPLTRAFAQRLGWFDELPEMTGTWSPDVPHNRLDVRVMEFKPVDPTAASRAFTLECHGHMESFAVVRKSAKGKDSQKTQSKKTDVTCIVGFLDENGAANLTQYMRAVPFSSVTMTYDPTPVQAEIPTEDAQGNLDVQIDPEADEDEDDEPPASAEPEADAFEKEGDELQEKRGRGRPRKVQQ